MVETEEVPPRMKVWLEAARPRTLALAVAGIGLGILLAAAHGAHRWSVAFLALLTAILLQILSNLANDYGDAIHGADSVARRGPRRAVHSGMISRSEMKQAITLVAGLAAISGVLLVLSAFGWDGLLLVGLFLLLGALAIWAAISYTASSRPYGYAGLGDLAVFIFFGPIATAGAYFLQREVLPPTVLLPAISVGLFSVTVLNINNIRDLKSDRAAGKQSLPVRLGPRRARLYHWLLLLGGLLAAVAYVLLNYHSPWQWLFLAVSPLLLQNGLAVSRIQDPARLDPLLKQMSLTTLLFVATFGTGHLLA